VKEGSRRGGQRNATRDVFDLYCSFKGGGGGGAESQGMPPASRSWESKGMDSPLERNVAL